MRDESPNSVQRSPPAETDDDTPDVLGGSLGKMNAKIIGFTKEGDVIIRIPPELSEDLNTRMRNQSSITWDEPRPKINMSRLSEETDLSNVRVGRPMHRSTSSVTFKGKEKEPVVIRTSEAVIDQDGNSVSNYPSTDIGDFREKRGTMDEREYAPSWNTDAEKSIFNPMRQTRLEELRGWKPETSEAISPKSGGPGGDEKA